ncbi:unnamed protein product [Chironomus riparius]|uniref:Uncharacterized protein n=1 Tax=Chironomus riparius TaxID=315576 RepID=A0A9N9RLH6_9DIPT|nr:unnamed protein product [Chironomus riparius]
MSKITMKFINIVLFSFFIHLTNGDTKKTSMNEDLNRACIIRFLQIRGKLDEQIQVSPAPADMCRILLPLVYANHSERLCLRLWETKSIKAECVFETLKKFEFVDLELKQEIITKLKSIPKGDKRKILHEVTVAQREALTRTAKMCKSDFTYGGLFDEILGINSSLIALQREYCLLKYALENKFLDLRYININPRNIDVRNIECTSIIVQSQDESEEKLLEAFKSRKYSSDAINCLIEKYKDERIFGWNLAKDFLYKIKISENEKRAEDWRISKKLSDFNKISSNCLYSFNWSLFQFK